MEDIYYKFRDMTSSNKEKEILYNYAIGAALISGDEWLNSLVSIGARLKMLTSNEVVHLNDAIDNVSTIISIDKDDVKAALYILSDCKVELFGQNKKVTADDDVLDILNMPKQIQIFINALQTEKEFYLNVYNSVLEQLQK